MKNKTSLFLISRKWNGFVSHLAFIWTRMKKTRKMPKRPNPVHYRSPGNCEKRELNPCKTGRRVCARAATLKQTARLRILF